MNILINASELKQGGGIQVADSICRALYRYPQHRFHVVLSSFFKEQEFNNNRDNIFFYRYDLNKYDLLLLLTGRNKFLDAIVKTNRINIVLNVFGPSLWKPRCTTVTGFARAHLVMPESPYYFSFSKLQLYRERIYNALLYYFFKRSTDVFFTENEMISNRVERLFGKKTVTITNFYNQVFDSPELWIEHKLPDYSGITLLTISSYYPHKNLTIAFDILRYIKSKGDSINIRFVYTVTEEEFPPIPEEFKSNFLLIGKVNIKECPSLYRQCDIAFQPTLLECFTATYPEAMRMRKPIVTVDLDFARGICGDAASYYSPIDGKAAAESILKVARDPFYSNLLVEKGCQRLKVFDDYNQRVNKIINLMEDSINVK